MSREALPRVYVLILNWRGWIDTIQCLESVFSMDYPDYRVIVCDNDSGDGSLDQIAAWARGDLLSPSDSASPRGTNAPAPKPIRTRRMERQEAERGDSELVEEPSLSLVQTGDNLGFAAGNNVGIRHALRHGDAAFVWLLNNDTVVDPGALTALVETAQSDPAVGMVGSKLLHYDRPDQIQAIAGGTIIRWQGRTRYLGADEPDRGQWTEPLDLEYVTGASLLVRRELLETVGELDERYFLYSEEVDWCLRARAAGWRLRYAPLSSVWHKAGRSVGYKSVIHDYHAVRGMLLLVRRFYPALLPAAFGYSFYRCLAPKIFRLQGKRMAAVLRAYRDVFVKTPSNGNARVAP